MTTAPRSFGADVECPPEVLATGRIRLGGHQSNNLYVVGPDGDEYFIGALFRESYGEPIRQRLNRGIG